MKRCLPPSGRRLIFLACNNLYRENNGLVASRVKRKVPIHSSYRDNELDYESDIDKFGPKNRREFLKILANSRKLLGFSFFKFSIFCVFKERTELNNDAMEQKFKLVHLCKLA